MLPEPIPPGWQELQERARLAKTSEELAHIIRLMHAVLDEFEAATANTSGQSPSTNLVNTRGSDDSE